MTVAIAAGQAVSGDIVSDRHGSLWRRQAHASFALTYLSSDRVLANYGIEPDEDDGGGCSSCPQCGKCWVDCRCGR